MTVFFVESHAERNRLACEASTKLTLKSSCRPCSGRFSVRQPSRHLELAVRRIICDCSMMRPSGALTKSSWAGNRHGNAHEHATALHTSTCGAVTWFSSRGGSFECACETQMDSERPDRSYASWNVIGPNRSMSQPWKCATSCR